MRDDQRPSTTAGNTEEGDYRGYIPELDGLRALAILAVLLYHLHCPGCSLGWAGVPLFFVISGFLITRILLRERGRPEYLRNFYIRRSLRIFPIYYIVVFLVFAVLALVAIVAPHSRLYSGLAGTPGNPFAALPYYLLYIQTIPLVATDFKIVPLLGHTWSLAVEEQFYWIWPFVIAGVSRIRLVVLLAALIVAGPVVRAILLRTAPDVYCQTGILPDYVDTLAMGAVIAWCTAQGVARRFVERSGAICAAAGAIALAGLCLRSGAASFWLPATWARQPQNVLIFTALGLLFGGVVALCVAESRWVRWLRTPWLTHVGKISYGIYLYHMMTFYVVGTVANRLNPAGAGEDSSPWRLTVILVSILGTVGVASVSWRFIETPLNALKQRFTRTCPKEPVRAAA